MSEKIHSEEEVSRLHTDAKTYLLQRWEPRPGYKKLILTRGEGVYFWDESGNRYLDLISQLYNVHIGLNNRKVIEAAKKQLDDTGRETLAALLQELEKVEPWTVEALEGCVRDFAEATDRKLGKVAQPLRAALTGRATSPGIFDVLAVLGRDEALARLSDQSANGHSA